MTNEENLEILSTRYVAPRIMRLSSGRIAIIPMMGKGAPVLIDPTEYYPEGALNKLIAAIPTIDALEHQYASLREEHRHKPSATPRPLQPTLGDLA